MKYSNVLNNKSDMVKYQHLDYRRIIIHLQHQKSLSNELIRSRINNESEITNTTILQYTRGNLGNSIHTRKFREVNTHVGIHQTSIHRLWAQKFQIMFAGPSQPNGMIFRPEGNSLTCSWVLYDLISCKRTFTGFVLLDPKGLLVLLVRSRIH